MATGSMVTGSMVTGSMVTGSMVTGSMVTGSMVTGSMVTRLGRRQANAGPLLGTGCCELGGGRLPVG
jgi:hypothetical protein